MLFVILDSIIGFQTKLDWSLCQKSKISFKNQKMNLDN